MMMALVLVFNVPVVVVVDSSLSLIDDNEVDIPELLSPAAINHTSRDLKQSNTHWFIGLAAYRLD